MKRFMFLAAALLMCGSQASAGVVMSRLEAAQPGNLTLEDLSREAFIDVNDNGILDAGDALVGYAQIETTISPSNPAGNQIYAVFSQTFDPLTFTSVAIGSNTRYSSEFIATPNGGLGTSLDELLPTISASINGGAGFGAGAMIAIVEKSGGFSADLGTDDLPALGGVVGAITSILDAEGTLAFSAGIANATDFFAFESALLSAANDFVAGGIDVTENVSTSFNLGTFGAGLSVIDNNMGPLVTFNETLETEYFVNNTSTLYGQGDKFDVAVVSGTYNGISTGNPLSPLVQGGGLNFINNADLVVNATVVPEPATFTSWAILAVGGVMYRRRRS